MPRSIFIPQVCVFGFMPELKSVANTSWKYCSVLFSHLNECEVFERRSLSRDCKASSDQTPQLVITEPLYYATCPSAWSTFLSESGPDGTEQADFQVPPPTFIHPSSRSWQNVQQLCIMGAINSAPGNRCENENFFYKWWTMMKITNISFSSGLAGTHQTHSETSPE